jgi:hypothetical protein
MDIVMMADLVIAIKKRVSMEITCSRFTNHKGSAGGFTILIFNTRIGFGYINQREKALFTWSRVLFDERTGLYVKMRQINFIRWNGLGLSFLLSRPYR